jgi:hypothetical protein
MSFESEAQFNTPEPEENVEIVKDESHEGIAEDVFNIEAAKKETPFEILGRMGVIQQEIAKLRDTHETISPTHRAEAKKEMEFLKDKYDQLDAILKNKGGAGDENFEIAA